MGEQLTRYFVGRVEQARDALTAVKLPKYADEVCQALPRNGAGFERFTYWAETMAATVAHWASVDRVRAAHDPQALAHACASLQALAFDAREVLSAYQARLLSTTSQKGV